MAALVLLISLTVAVALGAAMLVLLVRRYGQERHAPQRVAAERAITRAYLARIAGGDAAGAPARESRTERVLRMEVAGHLMQLLRGAEQDRLLAILEEDGLVEALSQRTTHRRRARRAAAIRVLDQLGHARSAETLIAIARDEPDAGLRLEAAGALARMGRLPPPAETLALLRIDGRAPTPAHVALFKSLTPGHAEAIDAAAAQTENTAIRAMLVEALGASPEPPGPDGALARWSRDPAPTVRLAALLAAQAQGHPKAAGWVFPRLADDDSGVRACAAQTVTRLGMRQAIPALALLARDPSRWVSVHAAVALHALDPSLPKAEVA